VGGGGGGGGRGRGRGEEYRTMTREGHLDTSVRTELRSTLPVHLVGGPLARPCRIRSRSGVLRIALREGCREVFGDCRFELGSLGMFDTWLVDLGSEAGRLAGWLAGWQDSGEQGAGSRGRARGRGSTGGRQAGRSASKSAGRAAGRAAGRPGSSAASCILRRHPSVTVEQSKAKRRAPHDTHASTSRRIPTKTDDTAPLERFESSTPRVSAVWGGPAPPPRRGRVSPPGTPWPLHTATVRATHDGVRIALQHIL
jgi:hypothetical protein